MIRPAWSTAVAALVLVCLAMLAVGALRVVTSEGSQPLGDVRHVVVVGVPGLEWDDVDAEASAALRALAQAGAVATTSVRAGSAFTCPRDGWVTLGAGNRAQYSDPSGERCSFQFTHNGRLDLALPRVANAGRSFGAVPGLLGRDVSCSTAVGRDALLAVARGERVHRLSSWPTTATGWTDTVEQCPLTLVAAPGLRAEASARGQQLVALDEQLRPLVDALEGRSDTLLLVTSVSNTPGISPRLGAVIAVGEQVPEHDVLASASTNRVPYVQLIDVAPTALAALEVDQPSAMVGRAFGTVVDDRSLDDQIAALRSAERAASVVDQLSRPMLWTWIIAVAAVCALGVARVRPGPHRRKPDLRVTATAVVAFPIASLLTNLVPWWEAGLPALVLLAVTAVLTTVVTVVALVPPWGRHRFGPALVVSAIGFVTLGLDVATGSHLQLNNFLGYSPVVAGRFAGFGNMPFALFATFGLLLLAAVTHGRDAGQIRLAVAVGGFTLVALDGTPGLGSDFGGVLASMPAILLLGMVATGRRPSVPRVLAALASGVVVVTALAVADYQRSDSSQTHLGRFVGQVLDGTAITVLQRKGQNNLDLLMNSPVAWLVPVLLAMVWWLFSDPGRRGRALLEEYRPTVAAGCVGIAAIAVVGSVINDSGVAVLVASLSVAVPLTITVLATAAAPTGAAQESVGAQPMPAPGEAPG